MKSTAPWVLMHNSCGMLKLCLFWKRGWVLGNFSFFNLLLVLSWTSNWLLLLISVPVSGVMNHTRKACCYSRKMAGSLVAVEKIREIGVL